MTEQKPTAAEELELWRQHRCGNRDATDQLFDRYLYLVIIIARQYRGKLNLAMEDSNPSILRSEDLNRELADRDGKSKFGALEQSGCVGLVDAMKKFDPERKTNFPGYAWNFILGEILDCSEVNDSLPDSLIEDMRLLWKTEENFFTERNQKPSNKELAEILDWTVKKVCQVREAAALRFKPVLIDTFVDNPESEDERKYELPDPNSSTPEDKLLEQENQAFINTFLKLCNDEAVPEDEFIEVAEKAVSVLKPKERQAIYYKYMHGLDYTEIAKQLSITKSDVGATLSRARDRLQKFFDGSNDYNDFVQIR